MGIKRKNILLHDALSIAFSMHMNSNLVHKQASGRGTFQDAYAYADIQIKCLGSSKNAMFTHNFAWNAMSEMSTSWHEMQKRKLQALCNISLAINIQYMQITFIVKQIRYPVVSEYLLEPCIYYLHRELHREVLHRWGIRVLSKNVQIGELIVGPD